MNRRKLAALVAASFAGLMLSSPTFAADASKAQTTSPASGAAESRSTERADKKSEQSKDAAAAAKVDYEAAMQKCDALPSGERSSCVQDAKDAQSLAMNKGLDGSPAKRGAPESRSTGPQSAK